MTPEGEEAAEFIDVVVQGLLAIARDPQAGRKAYRVLLEDATEDYMARNHSRDRRRVSNARPNLLVDAGFTGPQLTAKLSLLTMTMEEAQRHRARGRGRRRFWRRFLKACGLGVDTLLSATRMGHALKELLDLADVVLDS